MVDIEELTKSMNDLANNLKNEEQEEPIPLQETPEKHWWQIGDILTRQDELLEQILLAIRALGVPIVVPPAPPTPSPPIGPPAAPPIPPEIGDKIDTSILVERDIRTALEGLDFKTGQATVLSAGTGQELLHQFETYLVVIRANTTNTNNIYIGDKGVSSTTGYILAAGESIAITIDVLKEALWVDADTSGDGVSWFALVR